MPYFRVILEGQGIDVPGAGDEPIIGFYTSRVLRAANVKDAAGRAMASVTEQWSRPPHSTANKSGLPRLSIVEILPLGFISRLFAKSGGGHAFYSDPDSRYTAWEIELLACDLNPEHRPAP